MLHSYLKSIAIVPIWTNYGANVQKLSAKNSREGIYPSKSFAKTIKKSQSLLQFLYLQLYFVKFASKKTTTGYAKIRPSPFLLGRPHHAGYA
jgi:hypothetical protein